MGSEEAAKVAVATAAVAVAAGRAAVVRRRRGWRVMVAARAAVRGRGRWRRGWWR